MPILYKRASDGGISVCIPVISIDDPVGFTTEQAYQRALEKDIPANATSVTRVDVLPASTRLDDPFFNAWSGINADGTVFVDTQSAVSIADANIQLEMDGYVHQLNRYTNLGKDTTAIQASIASCKSRYVQLATITAKGSISAQDLTTLKSLLPVASASSSVAN